MKVGAVLARTAAGVGVSTGCGGSTTALLAALVRVDADVAAGGAFATVAEEAGLVAVTVEGVVVCFMGARAPPNIAWTLFAALGRLTAEVGGGVGAEVALLPPWLTGGDPVAVFVSC